MRENHFGKNDLYIGDYPRDCGETYPRWRSKSVILGKRFQLLTVIENVLEMRTESLNLEK